MTLLAHTLSYLVWIIPLTTKLQLSPYQDHQIPTHNKWEREVDVISGTLHYPQNMPTSSLIYLGDESETQIKIWEWCCIRSYLPYIESFPRGSWKREERDFWRGTVVILVLAASYLNKCIKKTTYASLSIYFNLFCNIIRICFNKSSSGINNI